MDLIFPNQGLVWQLQGILSQTVVYHLYTNSLVNPTLANVITDLTEAAWTGYAAVSQTWSNFTLNGLAGDSGYAIAAPISFSNISGGNVQAYGYYVTDTGYTMLIAIAAFDGAPITIANGGTYAVLPSWGDFSELSS
jgi:hypothetical protein